MVPSIEAKASPAMTHDRKGRFDFGVIDSVYGRNSDLYGDVLGISPDATRKEIRAAFADLRDEFFQFQAQVENGNVVVTEGQLEFSKRRMDAVVAAFRILHDPVLRAFYDEARHKRSQRSSRQVVQDSNDPVEQAVHRALEKSPAKRAIPATTTRTNMGRSPLQSSSGASSTDNSSNDGEGDRNAYSSKKPISRRKPHTTDRNHDESWNTHSPTDLPSSGRSSNSERRNAHSPKERASRSKSSKRIESPANYCIMDEQGTPRRQQQVFCTSPSRPVVDGDSDSASVHSQDIGASRNYFTEKRYAPDTLSTIATADEDITTDEDITADANDNSYLYGSTTLLTYELTDQRADASVGDTSVADISVGDTSVADTSVGDTSVADSTAHSVASDTYEEDALSVASYTCEDETTLGDRDLGDLCCSSERSVSEPRGFVAKTRAILRAVDLEIKGSVNDTITAFDQVCNAFTLQEDDIQAVTFRIHKASQQLAG